MDFCYTCGEVCHRSSDDIDRGSHQSRHYLRRMERTVEDTMLIVAKEIITLNIVNVAEVRARELRATKQTYMDVAVKEVISIVFASQMMATTIGATPGQHLPSDTTTVINLTMKTPHRTMTSSTAPRQPLWPRTMLVTNFITLGDLYVITKAFRRATLAARALSATGGIIIFEESGAVLQGYADTLARSSW
jgi:hypothetical protein